MGAVRVLEHALEGRRIHQFVDVPVHDCLVQHRGDAVSLGFLLQLEQIHGAGDPLHIGLFVQVGKLDAVVSGVVSELQSELLLQIRGAGLQPIRKPVGERPVFDGLLHDMLLELVLQRAAVTLGRGVHQGLLIRVLQEIRDGSAIRQLLTGLVQLLRIDGGVQALLVAPEGIDRRSGGNQLPVDRDLVGEPHLGEIFCFDLVLKRFGPLLRVGHIFLGHISGNLGQLEHVFLERVLQGAAVAVEGGFPGGGGIIFDKIPEGLAFHQLFGNVGGLLGVNVYVEGLLFIPLGADGAASRHELGVVSRLFIQGHIPELRGFDLILEPFDAGHRSGHVGLRHVVGQLLHGADVFFEFVLQLAAVALLHQLVELLLVILHKAFEGLGFRKLIGFFVDLRRIETLFEAVALAPDRADVAAGSKNLGKNGRLIIGKQAVVFLQLFLERFNTLVGVGDHLVGQILGQEFRPFDLLLEQVQERAAVALQGRLLELAVIGIGLGVDEVFEALARIPLFPGILQRGGVDRLVQAVLLAANGADGLPGGNQLHEDRGAILLALKGAGLDLLLQQFRPLQRLGHIALGRVGGNAVHGADIGLEGVLQSAAVPVQGRLADGRGLGAVRQE